VQHFLLHRLGRAGLVLLAAALVAPLALPAQPAAAVVVPICFPVADAPVTYVGNFGDPRGGGRIHEGEDIMGQKLFRIVAPVSGVILDGTDGIRWLGTGHTDHAVRMLGDDGYFYAFLHMNNDTPGTDDGLGTYEQAFGPGIAPGVRVRAGQLLGYMGDSGNAEGAGAHLHFEMRSGPSIWSSVAFDPWDSLQAAGACDGGVSSPTHPFTAMDGVLTSDPDIASAGVGTFDVAGRGMDDAVWHRAWTGAGFSDWSSLGGIAESGPAVVSPVPGRLDVFVRGVDDALWQRTRINGSWGSWTWLGGIVENPDAASNGQGDIVVSTRGSDGAVWYRTFDGTSWSGWASAGGSVRSSAAVATVAPGTFDVYARGLDDALWRRSFTGGIGADWTRIGGIITADPDVTVADGVDHVVVRGIDGRLYHLSLAEPDLFQLVTSTSVNGGAGLTSMVGGRLDLVVRSPGNALFQSWWDGPGTSW
jgi:hypothetical protein